MNRKKILQTCAVIVGSLVAITAAVYIYNAFQATDQATGETNYRMLSPQQLSERLKNKNFYMVNVHTPYDGGIAGTDAFIAYNTITENVTKLPQDKSAEILVYCRTGRMSAIAARKLTKLGYTNVSDLVGGMEAWQTQGYEVLSSHN